MAREFKMGWRKIITSAIILLVSGAFGGITFILGVANSDHFTIIANSERLEHLEDSVVLRPEYDLQIKFISDELVQLNGKIDKLLDRL